MKLFVLLAVVALQSVVFYGQPRHITVASDGSGEFTSVQEAMNYVLGQSLQRGDGQVCRVPQQ